jgi:DNA-binding XRE family transcriptional regulator
LAGAHLASGQAPPEPKKLRSKGRGRTIEVPVPAKLAVKLAVRWARKRAGMTQADLARRAGLTQPAVARLEDPDYNPTLDMLERVAAALGTRLEVDLRAA